jgi:Trypsin
MFKRTSVFGALVALAVPAFVAGAQAAPMTVTKMVTDQEQSMAASLWTRERISAAKPMPIPVDRGVPQVDSAAASFQEFLGPVQGEPAGKAEPNAAHVARAAYARDWAAIGVTQDEVAQAADALAEIPVGTASVFTSYDVNLNKPLWKIYPHIWDGKLTFNVPGGAASCSATSISNNHIVTAAHCVYDTENNAFYNGWAFTPAFRNGQAPYGTFNATSCTVLTAWVNLGGGFSINSWTRHDVAVCKMGNNSAGQTLNGAVGWAGRLWNAGNEQLVFNSGYPARTYTDALIANGPTQYLRSCTAETFLQAAETLGSGCEWGRGISGGSWLVGYKPFVVTGQVNSVNSGLFLGQPNLYGARFNSSNIVPLCTASGC